MVNNLKFPKAQLLDLLDVLMAAADFTGAKLHLYSNDLTPGPNTILADFTECVFDGYAAASLTWSDAFYDASGIPVSTAGELLFVQTGSTGDTIFGGFITDTAGTKYLCGARITDAPFAMVNDGDAFPCTVKVGLNAGTIDPPPVP